MARKTALAVVLLLLAQAAFAVPGVCCCPRLPAARTVRAADCCAAMPGCQGSLSPVAPSAVISQDRISPTPSRVAPEHSATPSPKLTPQIAEQAPVFTPSLGPPLYRLHAQLLI